MVQETVRIFIIKNNHSNEMIQLKFFLKFQMPRSLMLLDIIVLECDFSSPACIYHLLVIWACY